MSARPVFDLVESAGLHGSMRYAVVEIDALGPILRRGPYLNKPQALAKLHTLALAAERAVEQQPVETNKP